MKPLLGAAVLGGCTARGDIASPYNKMGRHAVYFPEPPNVGGELVQNVALIPARGRDVRVGDVKDPDRIVGRRPFASPLRAGRRLRKRARALGRSCRRSRRRTD